MVSVSIGLMCAYMMCVGAYNLFTSRYPLQQSDAEMEATAEAMGYGAVKYFDLNKNRVTDYKFDYEVMCSLNGNTAVYLLYAHARICSILRNAAVT